MSKPSRSPRPDPSRREFLSRSAAAAGAVAAGACASKEVQEVQPDPRPAQRAPEPEPDPIPVAPPKGPLDPDEPIRMGIIGTGGMGNGHLDSTLAQIERGEVNVQVVALADVCQPRLDEALAKARDGQQGIEVEGYRNYNELLARDDVHCVLVAAPEHWHAQLAVDALTAGKDVYLEKPMTLRLREALWLYDVMRHNPHMRVQVGTQFMMQEKYAAAKKLVAEGAIGKPVFSQTSYCRNSKIGEWNYYEVKPEWQPGPALDWEMWCGPLGSQKWDPLVYARWRRYRKYSTGIIGDLLVHVMTPLIYALDAGWPTRVVASGGHYIDKAMENHDQVNIQVEFETEQTLIVAGSTCNETGLEILIRGHEGNIYLGGNNCVLRPEPLFADDIDAKTIECDNSNEQEKLRENFWNAVRTREENISQVEFATKVMVIVDLATRSMWEGGAYKFDPKTMRAASA